MGAFEKILNKLWKIFNYFLSGYAFNTYVISFLIASIIGIVIVPIDSRRTLYIWCWVTAIFWVLFLFANTRILLKKQTEKYEKVMCVLSPLTIFIPIARWIKNKGNKTSDTNTKKYNIPPENAINESQ